MSAVGGVLVPPLDVWGTVADVSMGVVKAAMVGNGMVIRGAEAELGLPVVTAIIAAAFVSKWLVGLGVARIKRVIADLSTGLDKLTSTMAPSIVAPFMICMHLKASSLSLIKVLFRIIIGESLVLNWEAP